MTNDLQQALDVLRSAFGLTEFRPKQVEVIQHVLAGRNTLALLPTGYGKSICYQVPSQLLPGVTLVVSPLIALMQDQLSGLSRRGITNATVINSTLEWSEISERLRGIKNGAYKLVYVAPERFESPRFRELLAAIDVSLMVIDEAHCISQWGHDFRPQYRVLGDYVKEFKTTTVLAVTATATPTVRKDIVKNLDLPAMEMVEGSFDRQNLLFAVKSMASSAVKDKMLLDQLTALQGPCIIYTSSRKEAERVGKWLKKTGRRAGYYHAGLSMQTRARTQRNFETDKLDVIVCTVAFGMGVDKPNIRQVIHYNLPGSIESYYQEAGRAGRDGQQALCTLMYQPKDIFIHRWLIDKKDVSAALKKVDRDRLETMIRYADTRGCRRKYILQYFGQEPEGQCTRCDVCQPQLLRNLTATRPSPSGQLSLPL